MLRQYPYGVCCGSSCASLDLCGFVGAQSRRWGMLTELQSANVGHHRPAILGGQPVRVRIHDSVTLGHDIEEVAIRRLAQANEMIRRRRWEAPAYYVSIPVPQPAVTGHTVDIEAVLAPLEQLQCDRVRVGRSALIAIPPLRLIGTQPARAGSGEVPAGVCESTRHLGA